MSFEQSIFLFNKGGAMMYPLFMASIITLAIGVERLVVYRRASKDIMLLWKQVKQHLVNQQHQQALALCETSTNAAAPILYRAASCISNQRSETIRDAMEGEAAAQISKLRLRLSYLSATITLAPLLGLLGTVLGMIKTFNVLSLSSGQPGIITGGVGEALIATAAGLCVAIIAALFHSYFSERLEDIITSLEIITNNFLEVLELVNR